MHPCGRVAVFDGCWWLVVVDETDNDQGRRMREMPLTLSNETFVLRITDDDTSG
jgi:hypothetical protein